MLTKSELQSGNRAAESGEKVEMNGLTKYNIRSGRTAIPADRGRIANAKAAWALVALLVAIATFGGTYMCAAMMASNSTTTWRDLPPLPESIAGQCVGTIGDLLVVAGGSSWNKPPWSGGVKHWSDAVFGLAPGSKKWRLIGHLPYPVGYGSAVQIGKEMLCIGGQDAKHVYASALRLGFDGHGLTIQHLPNLPRPITNASAGLEGGNVYVVGGQNSLEAKDVSKEIWSLDLNASSPSWKGAPSPPWKHARILPVVAGCGSDLYVVSGADLTIDKDGTSRRSYLKDAWLLKGGNEWSRLPDVPAPVTGAPAICGPAGSLLIFGGDDGGLAAQIFTLKDRHPGFSRKILRVKPHRPHWSLVSPRLPLSLATTGATIWNGQYVIAGGENKPGHRSNRVIAVNIGLVQREGD